MCLGNSDCSSAVGGVEHAVSLVLQGLARKLTQVVFVLYQQNGFTALTWLRGNDSWLQSFNLQSRIDSRQSRS